MVENIRRFLNINYNDFYGYFGKHTKIFNSNINNFEIFWKQIGFVTGKLKFEISSAYRRVPSSKRKIKKFNRPGVYSYILNKGVK